MVHFGMLLTRWSIILKYALFIGVSCLLLLLFSVEISTVVMITAIVVMITFSSVFHSNPYLVLHCVY